MPSDFCGWDRLLFRCRVRIGLCVQPLAPQQADCLGGSNAAVGGVYWSALRAPPGGISLSLSLFSVALFGGIYFVSTLSSPSSLSGGISDFVSDP